MSWESPITQFSRIIEKECEDELLRVVHQVGFDVDKEELAKALQYDRGQYEKGYEDGRADGYASGRASGRIIAKEEITKEILLWLKEYFCNLSYPFQREFKERFGIDLSDCTDEGAKNGQNRKG